MKTVRLYKITLEDQVIVTPKKPSKGGYRIMSRLIADPGKMLTNGTSTVFVVDTNEPESWTETEVTHK